MTRSNNLGKLVCERKQKASHLDQRWNVTSDQQNQVLGLIDVTWTRLKNKRLICDVSFFFSVQLHGVMRVVMEPLLGDIPLIGALSVFFLKKPVSTLTFGSLWNAFRSCCFHYVSWSDFYINESQNALFSLHLDLHCKKGEHQAFYMKAHANFELITCRVLAYQHQLLSLRSYWFSLPDGGPAGTVHSATYHSAFLFSLLEGSLTQALLYQCIPSLWLLPSFLCFNTVPLLDSVFDGGTQRKNICYHNLQIEMWNCPCLNKHTSSVWN